VRIAVHAKDHVYLESFHTASNAFRLKPLGHKATSRLIRYWGALIALEKTFIIGNRQTQINIIKKIIIIISPVLDLFKFITYYLLSAS